MIFAPYLILPPEKPAIIRPHDGWRIAASIDRAMFPFPFAPPASSGFRDSAGPISLDTDSAGWNGWTLRQVIDNAQLSNNGDTKVRITMEGGAAEGFVVNTAYIQYAAAAGDAYDFSTTPVQIQVGASNSWTVGAGATQVSDEITITVDTSKDFVISFQCNNATDTARSRVTQTGWQSYSKNALDAATVDATGYASGNAVQFVNLIESKP